MPLLFGSRTDFRNKSSSSSSSISVHTTPSSSVSHHFIRVSNFPHDVTVNDLRQYFHNVTISRLVISEDGKTAYIECDNTVDKNKLLAYDNKKVWGRTLSVHLYYNTAAHDRKKSTSAISVSKRTLSNDTTYEFDLPSEVLMHIASYMKAQRDIFLRFSMVNRQCYNAVRSTMFWSIIRGNCNVSVMDTTWFSNILAHQNYEQIILANTLLKSNISNIISENIKRVVLNNVSTYRDLITMIITDADNVEMLHLEKCNPAVSQIEILLNKVKRNLYPHLTQLVLRQLSIPNYQSLASALSTNTTIVKLNISGVKLGVKGAVCIANALEVNSTISDLNMFGCFIEVQGAEAIAKALVHQKHLICVDIGMNRVRDTGFKAFIPVFEQNSVLQVLKLRYNMIKDRGMKSVMNSLCHTRLQALDLCFNCMSDMVCIEAMNSVQPAVHMQHMEYDCKKKSVAQRTLYISPLSPDMTSSGVIQLLKEKLRCTAVKHVTMKNHRTGSMQYAFVELTDKSHAHACVEVRKSPLTIVDGTFIKLTIVPMGQRFNPRKFVYWRSSRPRSSSYGWLYYDYNRDNDYYYDS